MSKTTKFPTYFAPTEGAVLGIMQWPCHSKKV